MGMQERPGLTFDRCREIFNRMANKILLIDPRERSRRAHRTFLCATNDVVEASFAAAALEDFEALAPDVVVVSLRQVDTNGIKLCKALRALPGGDRCLLILHGKPTADIAFKRDREALEKTLQADHFVPKELDGAGLAALIDVALARCRPTVAEAAPQEAANRAPEPAGVGALPDDRDLTWREVFRAPLNMASLRLLATRQVRWREEDVQPLSRAS